MRNALSLHSTRRTATLASALRTVSIAALVFALLPSFASADFGGPRRDPNYVSPERFALELRIGPYTPNAGAAFEFTFSDPTLDPGLLYSLELDVMLYRFPWVGTLSVGTGIGWARFNARAFSQDGSGRTDEETDLVLVPVPIMAVLRVDTLPRYLNVPFVLTGKLGLDIVPWSSSTGDRTDGEGVGIGLRWAIQLGMELDFLEPSAARTLDEDWGINHAFLFFELFGSTASDDFGLGGTSWSAGLGFNF